MGNPNLITINPPNPQQVPIKNTTLTFSGSGNVYDLNDPDLQYFITNTQFDKQINNLDTIYSFLNDMKYTTSYGDKKSTRYYFIKELIKQYYQQSTEPSTELFTQLPNQVQCYAGSGSNGETARKLSRSHTNQYVFLPSGPDELVDQLKLLYFEKIRKK